MTYAITWDGTSRCAAISCGARKSRCPQVPDAVHPAGRVVVRASRDAGEHERMDLIPADINRMELFSGSYDPHCLLRFSSRARRYVQLTKSARATRPTTRSAEGHGWAESGHKRQPNERSAG